MSDRYVIKHPRGWSMKAPGDKWASSVDEAERAVGSLGWGEVRIQDQIGGWQDSDSELPGNDPNPPRDRKHWVGLGQGSAAKMKVFVSYSHKDEEVLERLRTHLAMTIREGRIDEWFDREILPGGEIDAEIAERLESSGLFLLLVSPDFLASDYCVEREMDRALERYRSGDARVVPIIVEPCDWKFTPLRDLKALPKDGKPISEWTNENNAFLDIVQELRRVLGAEDVPHASETGAATVRATPAQLGVRRYRVKRDFDEIDRSDFREATFGVIRNYFEHAVAEIDALEDLRGRFMSLSATSFNCTIVNRARVHGTAHITVHARREYIGFGDISYSFTENAPPDTANGMYSIAADEYELYLNSMMGFGVQHERLSPKAAAKQLWESFLEQAGITSD